MGRKKEPMSLRLKRSIANGGDEWIKRKGETGLYCMLCNHDVRYPLNSIASKLREHCSSKTHTSLIRDVTGKEPKPPGRGYCTDDDDEESEEEEEWVRSANSRVKYTARSAEEIAGALVMVETTVDGNRQGPNDGETVTNDGSTDGNQNTGQSSSKKPDLTWNYFRQTGRVNSSDNEIWECAFCDYEAVRNVTHFRRHLFRYCPGTPDGVKDKIRAQGGKIFLGKKRKKNRPFIIGSKVSQYMYEDSGAEEEEEMENGEDVQVEDRAVQILTKLLAEQNDVDKLPADYGNTGFGGNRMQSGGMGAKRPLDLYTDQDLDREIKELQVKKMRAEVRKLEEQTTNELILKRKYEQEMVEGKERVKLFSKISTNLDKLISVANLISAPHIREVLNLASKTATPATSSNILQEAFNDTINGRS